MIHASTSEGRDSANYRRLALKLIPAIALIAFVAPSSAFGQATRTWVSGVGDDANPCSRTAPCKTFAGAISKTASGGEINCLDPGGFGGVTITKSLAIKCHYTEGGVLVSGTNAIVINAAATDKVTLRGLDINGIGTGAQTSLSGIKILSAKTVKIIDSEIYRFKAGVASVPTSTQTRVFLSRNDIHDNGVGVFNAPGNNAVSFTTVIARHNDIQDNTCGVATSSFGSNNSTPDASSECGAAGSGSGINRTAFTGLYHNGIHGNGTGVHGRGGVSVTELGWNEIVGNSAFGLRRVDSAIHRTLSPATNVISDNAASDPPNASQAQQ
jgi:hypothetical protein